MIKHKYHAYLATVFLLALMVACGRSDDESASDLGPTATTAPPATTELPATVAPGDTDGDRPGASLPADFDEMLAGLGSHQVAVIVTFDGQDASGQPVTFAWQSQSTGATDPPGYRLDLFDSVQDQPDGVQTMSLVRSGEESYLYLPSIGCISGGQAFAGAMTPPLDPADLLNGLSGAAQTSEGGIINGLATTAFHFDEQALAWASSGSWFIDGVAYVTEDGAFITQALMTIKGQGDLLAEGRVLKGEYQVTVNVTDLDESTVIEAPEACRQAVSYPVTEDAYELSAIEELVAYKSRLSMAEVVDFYLAEMAAGGWQLTAEPDLFDDLAFLNYEKDGDRLTIAIDYDFDTESVSILLTP